MGRKKAGNVGNSGNVEDYRHLGARRKNNPPAKIAAEGVVPVIAKAEYRYSPRRPPVLRFDPAGAADALPDLLEAARTRPLNDDEVRVLADALHNHEPWLEWAGKLEAQESGFSVDPVALHLHERVSTRAILRVAARQDVEKSLFGDPELEYHEAVQFYQHDIDWTNRLILGDSLQVMSSLALRENLAGQVQMIYMDPPYGIKYGSNFQPEIGTREVSDTESDLTREPEMVKAYRDTWYLGLHSYIAYLRDRLIVAKQLLTESGSLFLQIGDENLHVVRQVLNEVFGVNNYVVTITLKKKSSTSVGQSVADHLLWYYKDKRNMRLRRISLERGEPEDADKYRKVELENGVRVPAQALTDELISERREWFLREDYPVDSQHPSATRSVPITVWGRSCTPPPNRQWTHSPDVGMVRLEKAERLRPGNRSAFGIVYWSDSHSGGFSNVWTDVHGEANPIYAVQTNRKIVERCMLMTTGPGDLVLDPTCGSGTTAYVAEQWGRRWITVDTSRVAVAIARQRLLTAQHQYYELMNPSLGVAGGFRYKTISNITLKSIAQNVNLDPIFAKHEPILDEMLARCNEALSAVPREARDALASKLALKARTQGRKSVTEADRRRWALPRNGKWEHWEVPFDADPDYPPALTEAVTEYRRAWRAKMDEVNACIAANADNEELVDQPTVVSGVVRVSGPFSVEAVQPPELSLGQEVIHVPEDEFAGAPEELDETFEPEGKLVLSVRNVEARPDMEVQNIEAYLDTMIKKLRLDGIYFPGNSHMGFTRLQRLYSPRPGLHADGRITADGEEDADPEGEANVCVSFGPQYGPVTAKMVEEVVRSASRAGYDHLVVAGFNFDAAAQAAIDEAQHPSLRIHMAHIAPSENPAMAGLLKDRPGSQLFTVFGRPRTRVDGPDKESLYTVTMEGVDIYNPVDNSIVPTGAGKVAAWFIDGDYDGRTFCITQAFFPDRKAWKGLERALAKVIDSERFEALSGTTSLPFARGKHGAVAVKVIDPRGNEVMRVHGLEARERSSG